MSSRGYRESDVRRLCAESMNNCMFEGCNNKLVMGNTFIGEVCHIEAKREKGPRYNKRMSKEEREGYDNLILMCRNHHALIDKEPEKYTVEILHKMKDRHLRRGMITQSQLNLIIPVYAEEAMSFAKYIYGDNCSEEEAESIRKTLDSCERELARIPESSRRVFCESLKIAYESYFGDVEVDPYELDKTIGIERRDFLGELNILSRHGLITEVDVNVDQKEYFEIQGDADGWPIWIDIKKYCEEYNISPSKVLVELDFSIFDAVE